MKVLGRFTTYNTCLPACECCPQSKYIAHRSSLLNSSPSNSPSLLPKPLRTSPRPPPSISIYTLSHRSRDIRTPTRKRDCLLELLLYLSTTCAALSIRRHPPHILATTHHHPHHHEPRPQSLPATHCPRCPARMRRRSSPQRTRSMVRPQVPRPRAPPRWGQRYPRERASTNRASQPRSSPPT